MLGKLRQGRDVLLNVDVQGAATIRARAEADAELRRALVTVFLTPPSLDDLEGRLRKRGTDSPAEIQKRLGVARQEIAQWRNFDYLLLSTTHQTKICGGCWRLWKRRKCASARAARAGVLSEIGGDRNSPKPRRAATSCWA